MSDDTINSVLIKLKSNIIDGSKNMSNCIIHFHFYRRFTTLEIAAITFFLSAPCNCYCGQKHRFKYLYILKEKVWYL